jgi:hypothetical protein
MNSEGVIRKIETTNLFLLCAGEAILYVSQDCISKKSEGKRSKDYGDYQ